MKPCCELATLAAIRAVEKVLSGERRLRLLAVATIQREAREACLAGAELEDLEQTEGRR